MDYIRWYLLTVQVRLQNHCMAIIFQESYDSSTLPPDWKAANIVPIFKKGDKLDPNNYRPVSLTCVPCKIMESIIKDNMISVLETNHTIVTILLVTVNMALSEVVPVSQVF